MDRNVRGWNLVERIICVGIFLRLQLFAQDAKSFTSIAGEKKMKYDANR